MGAETEVNKYSVSMEEPCVMTGKKNSKRVSRAGSSLRCTSRTLSEKRSLQSVFVSDHLRACMTQNEWMRVETTRYKLHVDQELTSEQCVVRVSFRDKNLFENR